MNKNTLSNILLKAIYASSDSVVITDASRPDNPIIFANPAFERLTGYSNPEIEGRNCRFLQGVDRDQSVQKRIRGAVLIGTESREVIRNYRKDGSMFLNYLSITPIYNRNGRVEYFLGVQHETNIDTIPANGK